ncbi:LytTR family transcriptional regulator, partial [Mycobacterium avium subsp. hominissuis]
MNGDFPPRGRRPGRQGPPRQPGPEPSPVIPRPGGPAPSPHAPTQPLHRPPPAP